MRSNDSAAWTPEEIEALPQTETVFNQEALDFHKHTWRQEGYEMVTEINGNVVGVPIPYGKMLVKGANGYELVDEFRTDLDPKRASAALTKSEHAKNSKVFLARKDVAKLKLMK